MARSRPINRVATLARPGSKGMTLGLAPNSPVMHALAASKKRSAGALCCGHCNNAPVHSHPRSTLHFVPAKLNCLPRLSSDPPLHSPLHCFERKRDYSATSRRLPRLIGRSSAAGEVDLGAIYRGLKRNYFSYWQWNRIIGGQVVGEHIFAKQME